MLVYDIESDGSISSQSLIVSVAVEELADNFTCPLPSGQSLI